MPKRCSWSNASLPHGHVAAALTAARQCGAEAWFAAAPEPLRPPLLPIRVAWLLTPSSKLATHRMLHDDTATRKDGQSCPFTRWAGRREIRAAQACATNIRP